MFFSLAIISIFLSLLYLSIIFFLFSGFRRLSSPVGSHNLKFSVVIAAHNEEQNIEKCLSAVFSQTLATNRYEVIIINDRSTDATAAIALCCAQRHANLSVLSVEATPPGMSPKKHAVMQGISAAKYKVIVFTDADCIVPPRWLETIDKHFDEDIGLVQGITVYEYLPGMNRAFFGLQAADFLSHAVVSAAAIGAGLPINSNANNFAFRKAAFDDAFGYGKKSAVISGDDDLLLQRIWQSGVWRIRYMADIAGKVTTLPTETVRGVFEQRKRWGSKTVHYNARQAALLGAVFLFYAAMAVLFFAGFWNAASFALCGGMLFVKVAGEMVLMIPGTRLFGEKRLRAYLTPASLVQLPLVLVAVVLGVFGKFVWKDQRFSRTSR
jgi:cellulose synthase/poly-beta-1,6-N-acetylglucosamine synthase-like glycosyltransferase